jgi:hypothetical protein
VFGLGFTRREGMGLGYSYEDVMEMPVADIEWFNERLDDAIKAANKRAKSKDQE